MLWLFPCCGYFRVRCQLLLVTGEAARQAELQRLTAAGAAVKDLQAELQACTRHLSPPSVHVAMHSTLPIDVEHELGMVEADTTSAVDNMAALAAMPIDSAVGRGQRGHPTPHSMADEDNVDQPVVGAHFCRTFEVNLPYLLADMQSSDMQSPQPSADVDVDHPSDEAPKQSTDEAPKQSTDEAPKQSKDQPTSPTHVAMDSAANQGPPVQGPPVNTHPPVKSVRREEHWEDPLAAVIMQAVAAGAPMFEEVLIHQEEAHNTHSSTRSAAADSLSDALGAGVNISDEEEEQYTGASAAAAASTLVAGIPGVPMPRAPLLMAEIDSVSVATAEDDVHMSVSGHHHQAASSSASSVDEWHVVQGGVGMPVAPNGSAADQ